MNMSESPRNESEDREHRTTLQQVGIAGGWLAWCALVGWQLTDSPGINMDEAWSIISARGAWAPADPLSGMTRYAGPLPVLLLKALGTEHGVAVLRVTSAVCNTLALFLIGQILRRITPASRGYGWALPLVGTLPVWLVAMRSGIEIQMFGPLLGFLGLYLLLLGHAWAAFLGGVAFGLSAYSHLLGAFFPAALYLAWLVVYRRQPPIRWPQALAGLVLGFSPRLAALALYPDIALEGSAARHQWGEALRDLPALPEVVWNTLNGGYVYLRWVGHHVIPMWPYWSLALLLLVPWLRRPRSIPRTVWVSLVAIVAFCVMSTLTAPTLGVRYLVLPLIGVCIAAVQLGTWAIERQPRWAHLVRGVAFALIAGNLVYMVGNFYVPWARDDLRITTFALGHRAKRVSNRAFLPKDDLKKKLLELQPRIEQVVSSASIDRPLRAVLHDTGIRSRTAREADKSLQTAVIVYRTGHTPERKCVSVPKGRLCFGPPEAAGKYFLVYH